MVALNDADLLGFWDATRQHTLPRRAAALLRVGWPEWSAEEVSALPLDEAHRRLLHLRIASFGRRLDGVADCPDCGEALEFTIDARALVEARPEDAVVPLNLDDGVCRVVLRLPTVAECIAAVDTRDAGAAYAFLLGRCVAAERTDGTPLDARDLSASMSTAVDAAFGQASSAAEWLFALHCPACDGRGTAPLDIAAFCCAEIDARVPRLLGEVHRLASHYGWSESDILRMSRARRDHYLQLVDS